MDEKGCGCSNSIAAIIILVIAALVGVGWYQWTSSVQEQAMQAEAERRAVLARQVASVADDVDQAERWAEAGDLLHARETLEHMEEKLAILEMAAVQTEEPEEASRIARIRATVTDAIEAIDSAESEEQTLHVAEVQLEDIRNAFEREAPVEAPDGADSGPEPPQTPSS